MSRPPYEDAVTALAAATGTVSSLTGGALMANGVRFVTAGTFICTTKRGGAQTFTGVAGEVIQIQWTAKAVGTADIQILI